MAQGMNSCWSAHPWKLKALIKNWFCSQIILFQFFGIQAYNCLLITIEIDGKLQQSTLINKGSMG
jgi:hypothetical protein